MTEPVYDLLICGGGPIGAATAYYLTQQGDLSVALVTQEPTDQAKMEDHSDTYNWAGGSIRWHWATDPTKGEMPKYTADVIKKLVDQGVDLSEIMDDSYLFLHRGLLTPAINISGAKLVNHLLLEAKNHGLHYQLGAKLTGVRKEGDLYKVTTSAGEFTARKVLLALGVSNDKFYPDLDLEVEKRQLFVLDLPITPEREHFPHTIVKIGEGVAYVFLKKTPNGLRLLVGHEDVVEGNDEAAPEDYFAELLEAGLGDVMPFLKEAKVETIQWGFDAEGGYKVVTQDERLFAANCGSAVRSCAWIGRDLAKRLTA